MRKEQIITTNNNQMEEKGMKNRFIHFKKRFVPALSGALMGVMLMSTTCFAAGTGTSAVTQPLENLKTLIIAVIGAVDILMAQSEDEAKDIALSLELFVNGSLNIFNHQTNVDVDNRFTVCGIRDLGTELSPLTLFLKMWFWGTLKTGEYRQFQDGGSYRGIRGTAKIRNQYCIGNGTYQVWLGGDFV